MANRSRQPVSGVWMLETLLMLFACCRFRSLFADDSEEDERTFGEDDQLYEAELARERRILLHRLGWGVAFRMPEVEQFNYLVAEEEAHDADSEQEAEEEDDAQEPVDIPEGNYNNEEADQEDEHQRQHDQDNSFEPFVQLQDFTRGLDVDEIIGHVRSLNFGGLEANNQEEEEDLHRADRGTTTQI